jgi:V8-like Glu-specific endopeptidase
MVIDITQPLPATGWLTRTYRAALWLLTALPRLAHLLIFGRNHRQRELYATVTRLFPELGAYARSQHILNADGIVPDGDERTGWGFGSFEHLVTAPSAQNGHETTAPATSAATPANQDRTGRRRRPGFLNGTMATLLVCGGLALALIAGAAGGMPSPGWTDTRQEVYQLTGQNVQDADSVVALFPASLVRDRGDGTSQLLTDNYGEHFHLCPAERFREQPIGSSCSGVLVGEDVIATAGHCIVGKAMTEFAYVFGYRMRDATTPELIINNRDIYQAREVLAWRLDHDDADWALVRLDRPVVGHRIAQLRQAGMISKGQAVHAIGYPLGLPAKFAPGIVHSARGAALVTSIQAYPGNSGSPVINSTTHEVEGIIFGVNTRTLSKQGACFVSRATDSVATRASAFASALSTLRRNP